MGIFDKNKEKKEVKSDAAVTKPAPNQAQSHSKGDPEEPVSTDKKPEKKLTPQEQDEKDAQIVLIKLYPDNRLLVERVQNVETRSQLEYILYRAPEDFRKNDIARLTVMMLIEEIINQKKNKNVFVPGGK